MNDDDAFDLLTPAEASALLRGVPVRTLAYWRTVDGKGPAFTRVGKRVYYRRSAVAEWLRQNEGTRAGAA